MKHLTISIASVAAILVSAVLLSRIGSPTSAIANSIRTNPYMASDVKRAYGISSRFFWLC